MSNIERATLFRKTGVRKCHLPYMKSWVPSSMCMKHQCLCKYIRVLYFYSKVLKGDALVILFLEGW